MKIKTSKKLMLIATFAVLSSTMAVYAATTLFTQTFAGQTFAAAASYLTAGTCGGSLVLDSSSSTIPSSSGLPAVIVYDCGVSNPAFTSGSVAVPTTPTFTVPTGWTLGLDTISDPTPCSSIALYLATGTPVTLASGAQWFYCLTTSSASTYASFSITWSQ